MFHQYVHPIDTVELLTGNVCVHGLTVSSSSPPFRKEPWTFIQQW